MKIKLKNLNFDERLLKMRPLDLFMISRYRQSYRSGADLGPIIIDSKTKNIASGNHRVKAMLLEFGEDYVIEVEAINFKNYHDILVRFTEENITHGRPLNTSSMRMIAEALIDEGATDKEVANLLNVSVNKIMKWGSDLYAEVGNGKQPTTIRPIKRGVKNRVPMTTKQYESHIQHDLGIEPYKLAEQLTKWIKQDFIDTDITRNMESLYELYIILDSFLGSKKRKVG